MECGVPGKKRLRRSGLRRFAYRLALKLGHVNVKAMLRQINVRELDEWRAYADLEPFDEVRADLRAASIVQAVYGVHRGKGPRVRLKDCMLRFKEDEGPKTAEQARAQVKATLDLFMALQGPQKPRGKSVGK